MITYFLAKCTTFCHTFPFKKTKHLQNKVSFQNLSDSWIIYWKSNKILPLAGPSDLSVSWRPSTAWWKSKTIWARSEILSLSCHPVRPSKENKLCFIRIIDCKLIQWKIVFKYFYLWAHFSLILQTDSAHEWRHHFLQIEKINVVNYLRKSLKLLNYR